MNQSNLLQHIAVANGLPIINMAAPAQYNTTPHSSTASYFHITSSPDFHTNQHSSNNNPSSSSIQLLKHISNSASSTGFVPHLLLNSASNNDMHSPSGSSINPPPALSERHSKTNLYIKGLPEIFTDEQLENLVADKSKIKSLKAALEDDLRCKGYGFIDFVTEDDARKSLEHIQNKYPQYNAKFAKENEKDKTNLYVTNIPRDWNSKDSDKLKLYFEKYGQIQSAFIMIEKSVNKVAAGVGFVRFVNETDALAALTKIQQGKEFLPNCDRPLEAKYADKHNPETRKRRNPGSNAPISPTLWDTTSPQLQALRSNNCLMNPLSNNFYNTLCPTSFLLRGQQNNIANDNYLEWLNLYNLTTASTALATNPNVAGLLPNTSVVANTNNPTNNHNGLLGNQGHLLSFDQTALMLAGNALGNNGTNNNNSCLNNSGLGNNNTNNGIGGIHSNLSGLSGNNPMDQLFSYNIYSNKQNSTNGINATDSTAANHYLARY